MNKQLLNIIILFLLCNLIIAQAPKRFYTKFGNTGIDIGYGIKQTLDNGYIITGSSSSQGAGSNDAYLLKIDSMGAFKWCVYYGGFNNEVGKSVIQLQDSGYVLTGYTNSFGSGGYDVLVIRTDKAGNQLWQRTFGGIDWDFGNDLILSSDNHIIVCGITGSFGNGANDGFLLKYDLNGNLIWNKFYGGIQDDELRSVISTVDNKLVSVGYTKSKNDINGDAYFIKTDLNGDTLFTRTYGGNGFDVANDVLQKTGNEDYIMAGGSKSLGTSYSKSLMYSYSKLGAYLWNNSYYASNNADEEWVSVAENTINPFYTYYLRNVPVPSYKINGNLFAGKPGGWYFVENSFGGFEDEKMFNSASTKDGGVVCVGYTYSFNSMDKDIFIMKMDSTIGNYQSIIGLKENKTNEFLIKNDSYRENLIISNSERKATTISMYNINGALIREAVFDSDIIEYNYSSYSPGIYIISIKQKDRTKNIKVIVN